MHRTGRKFPKTDRMILFLYRSVVLTSVQFELGYRGNSGRGLTWSFADRQSKSLCCSFTRLPVTLTRAARPHLFRSVIRSHLNELNADMQLNRTATQCTEPRVGPEPGSQLRTRPQLVRLS